MQNPLCKISKSSKNAYKYVGREPAIFEHIGDIPEEMWPMLAPEFVSKPSSPFCQAVEEATSTSTGSFRYVALFDESNKVKAITSFQYVYFDIEQVLDKISKYAWVAKGVVNTLINPDHRLLVGGSVWLSGEHGRWASNEKDFHLCQQEAADYLIAHDANIFTVLLKDYADAPVVEGYHSFVVDPIMRLDLSRFSDWDDYQAQMRSKYRQRLKSAYKKSKEIVSWELELEEIESRDSELMALYYQVVNNDLFSLSLPPTDYLSILKKHLGKDLKVTGYFLKDRLVGFRATMKQTNLGYALIVGFSQTHNQPLKLYQRMLYDYVREAFQLGCTALDLGRTALEIKSCLGAEAQQHTLFVKFRYKWLHRMLKPVFRRLGTATWEPRHAFSTSYSEVKK